MIVIAGIALGIICAVMGSRRGFYAMWATFFNVAVSVYIAIMLTPTLSSYFGFLGKGFGDVNGGMFWYIYAGCVAGIAFLCFLIMEVMAMTYFTGAFDVTLPKLFQSIGAAGLGFLCGYIAWGFICFVVLIMPISKERIFTKAFTSDTASRDKVAAPAISKVLNTTNVFSMQSDGKRVNNVVSWTLGWKMDKEDANTPPAREEKVDI